jgi:hypothetical protein
MTETLRQTTTVIVRPVVAIAHSSPVARVTAIHSAVGLPAIGGGSNQIRKIAAATLNGHRAVAIQPDGRLIHADNLNPDHRDATLGIIASATPIDGEAIIYTFGSLTEPSWQWLPQRLLFLGANGQITQTPPTTGFLLVLGKAVTPTEILIQLQPTIQRL